MRKYLSAFILICLTMAGHAQTAFWVNDKPNNELLTTAFWKETPTLEKVKEAVAKGSNPAELNGMSLDPVVIAINTGAPNDIILYLLEQKGNEPTKLTHDGRTYMFWAAAKGNIAIMQYLTDKGGKLDAQDSHGMSVLNFAAMSSVADTKVYDLCIAHGVNPKKDLNRDGANALLLAIGGDTTWQITEYFLSKGLDIKSKDAKGRTSFDYAARAGNIKAMDKLFAKGVKPTSQAMVMAALGSRWGNNKLEVFQYLESKGAKVNVTDEKGDNPLHYITRKPNQTAIVQYFLDKGVDVNQADEDGYNVFMTACVLNKDTAVLNMLLPKLSAGINQTNKAGASALTLAVRYNGADIVAYLLEKGADAKVVDKKGNNLVYYLFDAKGFDAKLKLLQAKGVDVKTPQQDGSTIYHLAVAKNDPALLKKIKDYGVDVNAADKEGLTPLHKAAMMAKDPAILQYLISIGAKKDVKTKFEETAYDLAKENEVLSKNNVSVDFLKAE